MVAFVLRQKAAGFASIMTVPKVAQRGHARCDRRKEIMWFVKFQKNNTLLADLLQRVTKTESRIKVIEKQVGEARGTRRSTGSRKRDVPEVVRRETRKIYRMLIDEDEDFCVWKTGQGWRQPGGSQSTY